MIEIILNGCCGKMGKVITECSKEFDNLKIIGGIDKYPSNAPYPIFKSVADVSLKYDVLLDFSRIRCFKRLIRDNKKD